MAVFEWNKKKNEAAILLSEGLLIKEVAAEIGTSERTINRWKADSEFAAEIDRLTLMTGIASKAERLRVTKKIIRQKLTTMRPTDKDLLEWMKFAQSETDGIKLDLTSLLATFTDQEGPMADSGPSGTGEPES